jgi:hypothetical protein
LKKKKKRERDGVQGREMEFKGEKDIEKNR